MKKVLFAISFICFGFGSCHPGEIQLPNIYDYNESYIGFGTYEKLCDHEGHKCSVRKRDISFPWENPVDFISATRLSEYIKNDDLRGYFITQNWRSELPELVGQGNIIQYIIDNNPIAIVDSDRSLVILKNRNLPRSNDNILFTIVIPNNVNNSNL